MKSEPENVTKLSYVHYQETKFECVNSSVKLILGKYATSLIDTLVCHQFPASFESYFSLISALYYGNRSLLSSGERG